MTMWWVNLGVSFNPKFIIKTNFWWSFALVSTPASSKKHYTTQRKTQRDSFTKKGMRYRKSTLSSLVKFQLATNWYRQTPPLKRNSTWPTNLLVETLLEIITFFTTKHQRFGICPPQIPKLSPYLSHFYLDRCSTSNPNYSKVSRTVRRANTKNLCRASAITDWTTCSRTTNRAHTTNSTWYPCPCITPAQFMYFSRSEKTPFRV